MSSENKPVIVSSCCELDIDSVISAEAYSQFLKAQGFQVEHVEHVELTDLQKEIFELCKIDFPTVFTDDFKLDNCEIIVVNPYSIEKLHSSITPKNVVGIMGKKLPQYYDSLHEKNIHFEEVESFSTLIGEKFMITKTPIHPHIASLLLIGIILTLNGLEESITKNRDYVVLEYLQQHSHLTREQIIPLLNKI